MKRATAFGDTKPVKSSMDKYKSRDNTMDAAFKRLCARKEFLTPILKNVVKEYKDYTPKEIEQFIVDSSITTTVRGTEDVGMEGEAVVKYDVIINCFLPNGDGIQVDFIFDLEMQREHNPGYPIVKRGVYYCSRLLSAQISTLGEDSYNQLKPVYSVWIVRKGFPKELQNAIYTAGMHGAFNNGIPADKINKDVDLIHLVLLFLSENMDYSGDNQLQRYLQAVFSNKATDKLTNPYAEYSEAIEREVDDFMTLDQAARLDEALKTKSEMIYRMFRDNVPLDLIVKYSDLSVEEVKRIIKEAEEEGSI